MTPGFAVRWALKAVTPPILVLAAKVIAIKLGLKTEASPASVAIPQEEPPAQRPEWEYVPEGWSRSAKGWNVDAIVAAYLEKWPSYLRALEGPQPLGVYHEVASGETVGAEDESAHNMLVSYAYVLALAAHGKRRVAILDWGGGIGHYYPLSEAVLPGVEIEYHCKDVPKLAEAGRELFPDATFTDDDEVALARTYDLVVASGSLQYAEDWRSMLGRLGRAAAPYLYVTRLPVALHVESFVVLQRAYAYGYDTEYLGWVLNRHELLRAARGARLELVREFLLIARFSAAGAPEEPVGHRGYLFRAA